MHAPNRKVRFCQLHIFWMTDNSDICLVYLRVGDDERRLGKRVFRLGGGGGGGGDERQDKNCACSFV